MKIPVVEFPQVKKSLMTHWTVSPVACHRALRLSWFFSSSFTVYALIGGITVTISFIFELTVSLFCCYFWTLLNDVNKKYLFILNSLNLHAFCGWFSTGGAVQGTTAHFDMVATNNSFTCERCLGCCDDWLDVSCSFFAVLWSCLVAHAGWFLGNSSVFKVKAKDMFVWLQQCFQTRTVSCCVILFCLFAKLLKHIVCTVYICLIACRPSILYIFTIFTSGAWSHIPLMAPLLCRTSADALHSQNLLVLTISQIQLRSWREREWEGEKKNSTSDSCSIILGLEQHIRHIQRLWKAEPWFSGRLRASGKPSKDPLSGGKTSFMLALIIFAPIFDATSVKMAITAGRFRG